MDAGRVEDAMTLLGSSDQGGSLPRDHDDVMELMDGMGAPTSSESRRRRRNRRQRLRWIDRWDAATADSFLSWTPTPRHVEASSLVLSPKVFLTGLPRCEYSGSKG